jgi:hypothetical protein
VNECSDVSAVHREQTSTLLHTVSTNNLMTSEILSASTRLEDNLSNLSISSARTHTEILAIKQEAGSANTSLVSVGQKLDSLCQEVDAMRCMTYKLVSKPSLLSSFCDETERIQSLLEAQASFKHDEHNANTLPRRCNCRKRTEKISHQRLIGPIRLFKDQTLLSRHSKHCPCYIDDEETKTFGLQVSTFSRLLSGIVQLKFELTTGSGRFTLGHPLIFRAVVPCDSPAFNLVDSISYFSKDVDNCIALLSTKLRKLYRNREASPYDVDPNGRTLFHVRILSSSILNLDPNV